MEVSKDFVIEQISWFLKGASGEAPEKVRKRFRIFVNFLQDNNLTVRKLLNKGEDPKDDFCIRKSDLTDMGFELVRTGYQTWLKFIDRGGDSSNISKLENGLRKLRESGRGAESFQPKIPKKPVRVNRGHKGRAAPQELPDIFCETEKDRADLIFAITSHRETTDGRHLFKAEALHGDEHVGLQVELSQGWESKKVDEDIELFSGIVTYHSLGVLSDRLVRLMDSLYGTNLMPSSMKKSVKFTAVAFGDDPVDLAGKEIGMKLFFKEKGPEHYAEVYTNVDLPKGKLHILEKDEEYRKPLIQALAK